MVEGFRVVGHSLDVTMRSAQITGILAPLIAISVVMQQILSLLGAQAVHRRFRHQHGQLHCGAAERRCSIVFISGMILESLPVTIILAPILAPIAHSVGRRSGAFCGDLSSWARRSGSSPRLTG